MVNEILQRFQTDDEFCILFAKKIHPHIRSNFIQHIVQGNASFENCINTTVQRTLKAASDKFDIGFTISCEYALKRLQDNFRWFELNDRFNTYQFPEVRVVVRDEINLPFEAIVKGMKQVFKANTLFLGKTLHQDQRFRPNHHLEDFKRFLSTEKIHCLMYDEVMGNIPASVG